MSNTDNGPRLTGLTGQPRSAATLWLHEGGWDHEVTHRGHDTQLDLVSRRTSGSTVPSGPSSTGPRPEPAKPASRRQTGRRNQHSCRRRMQRPGNLCSSSPSRVANSRPSSACLGRLSWAAARSGPGRFRLAPCTLPPPKRPASRRARMCGEGSRPDSQERFTRHPASAADVAVTRLSSGRQCRQMLRRR